MKIVVEGEDGVKRPLIVDDEYTRECEENAKANAAPPMVIPVRKPLPPLKPRAAPPGVMDVVEVEQGIEARAQAEAQAAEYLAPTNRTAKNGGKSAGNDFYLTPGSFLSIVRNMGVIGLDPAGSAAGSLVCAEREYRTDRDEDGLALPWKVKLGELVYCNPPYSATRKWIEKADAEGKLGREIVMLIAARTETIGVQASTAKAICFWKGRLTFLDPETRSAPVDAKGKPTGAMFPSMVMYWGLREKLFRDTFAPHGRTVRWAI